ncbi:single-stranded-DNA-specific exonuclease RecJ [Psychroflexus salis]|uniref:Single-stranded-DNA-specific exonuclease RecJ n=1 Tax=Psychroflexus salis TaxID=1526574 RepID=A0A916ZTC7_9FLAO|nr:single-stranded-DNA-specific exonuclease RecJ [Psychroflexus salis]GGE13271.1 single-stranded-DNA-specific exonuclease RecJ [Psychroflexus salis]
MKWTAKPSPKKETIAQLQEALQVDYNIACLLAQRNISTFQEAKDFFRPNLNQLYSPWLMKGMQVAVERIQKAIISQERILIYGDYDVDGTTSVALLYAYFSKIYPHITPYIPDRYQEGYGVSYQGIDFAHDNEISLIIALDCGIKAIEKVAYAKEKGIDFIICDHHRPGAEIPAAVAVLDPKQKDCSYPYKELCGCGVGFKLLQAFHEKENKEFNELIPYLDLVATAIGSDIVPITGENRILAFHGLKQINQKPRPGFQAIIQLTNKKELTITDVVFIIGPRINAAGRMKHGLHAVELLIEEDLQQAEEFAAAIEKYNADRRETDQNITAEALALIEAKQEQKQFTSVVYQEHWHKGVIGIVASRLTETYYRPTLVFTKSGDKLAASARSVKGFDIYNALEASAEFIEQFGGHKYAAGLTLEEKNYSKFKAKFEEVVKNSIQPEQLQPKLNYDLELNLADITPKFYRILKQFAPFGPGNMSPLFYSKNLKDTGYAKGVGKNEEHLKCAVYQHSKQEKLSAIGFNLGKHTDKINHKLPFEAIYSIEENEWNNKINLQLRLRDVRLKNT